MATSPIYNWPEPDNTDLVKNGALAIRTLGDAIDTTMATMTPKSIVDAKGDLIAASAADTPARLAVGANGTNLVADSSTATGLTWKQGGLTLISQVSFSNVASQIFDSVFSTTYKSYRVVIDTIYAATGGDDLQFQLRYGSSTQTADYYGSMTSVNYLAAQVLTGVNNAAQLTFMLNSSTSTTPNTLSFDVGKVGVSANPTIFGSGYDYALAAVYTFGGGNLTARTYEGFLLKSSTSNITGTVSIYGYGS